MDLVEKGCACGSWSRVLARWRRAGGYLGSIAGACFVLAAEGAEESTEFHCELLERGKKRISEFYIFILFVCRLRPVVL